MLTRFPRAASLLAVAMAVCCLVASAIHAQGVSPGHVHSDEASAPVVEGSDRAFADQVDLSEFGQLAVHASGRLKSLDSFTHSILHEITGPHRIDGRSHTFTYFDMMLRPGAYADRDVIYIRKKPVRDRIARAVLRSVDGVPSPELAARMDRFMDEGLISDRTLRNPEVMAELRRMRADLIKTAKFVDEIDIARFLMRFETLLDGLKMIPPPGGTERDPWMTVNDFAFAPLPNADANRREAQQAVRTAWESLVEAWHEQDAEGVNDAADRLAQAIPTVNPDVYPEPYRSGWPWSFAGDGAATGWSASAGVLGVLIATGLFGVLTGRRRVAAVGLACGLAIAGLLGGALLIGRYNFLALESLYFNNLHWFTLNWVIYLFAIVFLLMAIVYRWNWARVTGMAVFLIAFAFQSGALLLRWYVADRWPNSNMFEAVTTAAWFGACGAIVLEVLVRRHAMRNLFALGAAAGSMVALMAAHFLPQALDPNISNMMPVLHDMWLYIHTNVIIFSYALIFMASIVAGAYLVYRGAARLAGTGGTHHYARVGGAGSLIMTRPDGSTYLAPAKTTLGQVLDGATMILMEVSFVLLWAGIVMGALWADHSWGRPWGWDPKEVFALNTFLVFAVLIHTRLKVKDKGLWTSLLVMLGCVVMLFNWIFINFKISGLHSYA